MGDVQAKREAAIAAKEEERRSARRHRPSQSYAQRAQETLSLAFPAADPRSPVPRPAAQEEECGDKGVERSQGGRKGTRTRDLLYRMPRRL